MISSASVMAVPLGVVHLLDADVVTADTADHFGQLPVEPEQQVDPQRVVRGVEKGPAPLLAAGFQFVEAIRPARRAAYDRRTGVDAGADVVVGRCGRREFERHVDAAQMRRVEVAAVVGVDDQSHAVSPFDEETFDLASHFPVSDDSCVHSAKKYLDKDTIKPRAMQIYLQLPRRSI